MKTVARFHLLQSLAVMIAEMMGTLMAWVTLLYSKATTTFRFRRRNPIMIPKKLAAVHEDDAMIRIYQMHKKKAWLHMLVVCGEWLLPSECVHSSFTARGREYSYGATLGAWQGLEGSEELRQRRSMLGYVLSVEVVVGKMKAEVDAYETWKELVARGEWEKKDYHFVMHNCHDFTEQMAKLCCDSYTWEGLNILLSWNKTARWCRQQVAKVERPLSFIKWPSIR